MFPRFRCIPMPRHLKSRENFLQFPTGPRLSLSPRVRMRYWTETNRPTYFLSLSTRRTRSGPARSLYNISMLG